MRLSCEGTSDRVREEINMRREKREESKRARESTGE